MSFSESKRRRVLVGRIGAGQPLRQTILEVAREHDVTTAWISAIGSLRSVELDFTESDESRRFTGALELLHLEGNLSSAEGALHLEARAQLARPTDNGIVVFGGRLIDAEALSVEVRIECMDDLGLRREREDATGLMVWRGASAKAAQRAPAATPSGASGWDMAAEVSSAQEAAAVERRREPKRATVALPFEPPSPSRAAAAADPESALIPERGDYVDHKQFGLCRVDQVSDDGGLLLRLETGRRKLIKLDFLEVLEPRMDDKRRIFPLRPRRKS